MSYDSWLAEPYEYPDRYSEPEHDPDAEIERIREERSYDMRRTLRELYHAEPEARCSLNSLYLLDEAVPF